jgi:hypothetical protein
MGHRTLSFGLVIRALFFDRSAYDEIRDDDNPFVEGLFFIVILGALTAILNLIGTWLEWMSVPSVTALRDTVLSQLQGQSWWADLAGQPQASEAFQRIWDGAWQVIPLAAGAPDLQNAAGAIVTWPLGMLASWLIYGTVAYLFARLLGGNGSFPETLGTSALAFAPMVFRGLGLIPFLVVGSVLGTWQLILRYQAVRSAHRLSWARAFWATVLPIVLLALVVAAVAGVSAAFLVLTVGR